MRKQFYFSLAFWSFLLLFFFVVFPLPTHAGALRGNVFIDENRNGVKDDDEDGYEGRRDVTATGPQTRSDETDSRGDYRIDLTNGTYSVSFSLSSKYQSTSPNPLTNIVMSGDRSNVNFGIIERPYIRGRVYVDTNLNGKKDSSESGRSNVTITATGPQTKTDATDSEGVYEIQVLDGTYTVSISLPSGYYSTNFSTHTNKVLPPDINYVDFGIINTPNYGVQSLVFIDKNNNKVYNKGIDTPYPGATIKLSGSSQETNNAGYLRFNKPPGTYTITINIPKGLVVNGPSSRTVTIGPDKWAMFPLKDAGAPNRVFITSTTYNGDLGGVSGADNKCQSRANSAGLGGTWRAWLNTDSESRFIHRVVPYLLVDTAKTRIASDWEDLTDGSLDNKLNINEFGNPVSHYVWTDKNSGADCKTWGNNDNDENGQTGDSQSTGDNWEARGSNNCRTTNNLYCFETTAPPSPTPTPTPAPPPAARYNISGNLFVDINSNGIREAAELNYSRNLTVTYSPIVSGSTLSYPSLGTYRITGLTAGSYTVALDPTSIPAGTRVTHPLNGPPPSFTVRVGPSCTTDTTHGSTCN